MRKLLALCLCICLCLTACGENDPYARLTNPKTIAKIQKELNKYGIHDVELIIDIGEMTDSGYTTDITIRDSDLLCSVTQSKILGKISVTEPVSKYNEKYKGLLSLSNTKRTPQWVEYSLYSQTDCNEYAYVVEDVGPNTKFVTPSGKEYEVTTSE